MVDISQDTVKTFVSILSRETQTDFMDKTRKQDMVFKRQALMYVFRKLTPLSLSAIGEIFDKDHATILHSVAQVEKAKYLSDKGSRRITSLVDSYTESFLSFFEQHELAKAESGQSLQEFTEGNKITRDLINRMTMNFVRSATQRKLLEKKLAYSELKAEEWKAKYMELYTEKDLSIGERREINRVKEIVAS